MEDIVKKSYSSIKVRVGSATGTINRTPNRGRTAFTVSYYDADNN
ncbi:MAG: hypothetical protein ACI8QF_004667 [Limisphaerales bacterium]|jgi:hypothetical protein